MAAKGKAQGQWEQFVFEFSTGATFWLAPEVFETQQKRAIVWRAALLRAATLGNFDEMRSDIRLLTNQGLECENLLEGLTKLYTKGDKL